MKNIEGVAIITGASSGIGLQFAHVLAEKGYPLLLVSNQEKELENVASELSATHNIQAIPFFADLTAENAPESILDYCKQNHLRVAILINNAGVFFFNDLLKTDQKRIDLMLRLHIGALTKLCKLFGEYMKELGGGYILNMSSLSAWWPVPGISTYNASKAYIRNLSNALHIELKPSNIGVTVLCPGGVATDLYGLSTSLQRIGTSIGLLMTPRKIAEIGIKKMFRKKSQVIPGFINKFFIVLMAVLPQNAILFIKNKLTRFQK